MGWSICDILYSLNSSFSDSNKLPRRLHEWLFPHDGRTRDFLTLQVSLGHNDEYFAFDQFGKISSRDHITGDGSSQCLGDMGPRKKSYTFSEPTSIDVFDRVQTALRGFKLERPRSLAIQAPLGLRSSKERQPILEPHQRHRSFGERTISKRRYEYVDIGIQTDEVLKEDDSSLKPRSAITVNSSQTVSMGLMQEYFRKQQYQLGDVFQGI